MISSGTWLSESSTSAKGYSPLNRAFSIRGRPGTTSRRKPKPVVKGGSSGAFEDADELLPVLLEIEGEEREGQVDALARAG